MRTLSDLREKPFPSDITCVSDSNSENIKQKQNNADLNQIVINESNESSKSQFNSNKSIGKLIYESEELNNHFITNAEVQDKSSDDDIQCITDSNAGPSGLNVIKQTIATMESIAVCDSSGLELHEIILDEQIEVNPTINVNKTNSEIVTIDDLSKTSSSDGEDDIEIIQVKYYSEPLEPDSDIEVLSEILTPKEVIDLMKNNLRVVQQLTNLSFTTMRVIMSKIEWDRDSFVNQYYEFGIDKILSALKLVVSNELKTNTKKKKTKVESEEIATCIVCFDETNKSQMFGSSCNHFLCLECWNNYITTKVNDNSSDDKILCPNENCSQLIDDEDLIDIIEDQNIKDRYRRLISNNFVANNQLLRWCPNNQCLHAVRVKYSGFQDIECICKTVFCFLCGEQWHEPLSCDLYKNWIQKYASQTVDPNSAEWLLKNTKCCPKCKFPIEKNGGCNYVMCTKCKYSFCFYCLGKCSHGRCVGANRSDAIEARTEDQRLKQDLQLYPFYKDSYQNQSKQLTLERKLQEAVTTKLEKAVKCPEFKSALKFLKNAFIVLCHCRQTLMYSYVFGYYLTGPQNLIQIYIEYLSELEKETTSLSNVLTREATVIHKDSVNEMKKTVQSSYRSCESRRSTLVQHIKHGLTANYWQFIPRYENF